MIIKSKEFFPLIERNNKSQVLIKGLDALHLAEVDLLKVSKQFKDLTKAFNLQTEEKLEYQKIISELQLEVANLKKLTDVEIEELKSEETQVIDLRKKPRKK